MFVKTLVDKAASDNVASSNEFANVVEFAAADVSCVANDELAGDTFVNARFNIAAVRRAEAIKVSFLKIKNPQAFSQQILVTNFPSELL
jgi:hypothetical protein